MCSAPDVPAPVSRQDTKMPERPATDRQQGDDRLRRRRGYAALLASTPAGAIGAPVTTASAGAAPTLGG